MKLTYTMNNQSWENGVGDIVTHWMAAEVTSVNTAASADTMALIESFAATSTGKCCFKTDATQDSTWHLYPNQRQ
jgi:hypothetical protein